MQQRTKHPLAYIIPHRLTSDSSHSATASSTAKDGWRACPELNDEEGKLMANRNLEKHLWYGSSGSERTMTKEREKLYHCSQHLLNALVETTTNERETRALYRSLEWLGVAEIRAMNAEASTKDLTRPGADLLSPTDEQTI